MASTFIHLDCAALPLGVHVLFVRGREGMNTLSRFEVSVLCEGLELDAEALIGSAASLRIVDEEDEAGRAVPLVVTHVVREGYGPDGIHFRLELGPWAALLALTTGYRVFLATGTQEIVAEVLSDAGVPGSGVDWRLAGTYLKRVQTVQYGETAWGFVERLLADEGISYWFDAKDDGSSLFVMGDDPRSHEPIAGRMNVPYEDPGGVVVARHVFELAFAETMAPTGIHLREFDVRAPDVAVEARAGTGVFEHFEYPAAVLTATAAEARAKVRLEQLRALATHAEGASNCARMQPGRLLRLTGCADDWMNGEYLVAQVEHTWTRGAKGDAHGEAYTNRLLLVPERGVAFRPPVPRTAPRIPGIESAITTGPKGEEIHVDDLGRVKVRFPWDRSGITDDRSSAWVRSLQLNMGGAMMLPRVGWEVPVAYIDGNPDRPVVLGRHYNATAVVPYALPGARATTTLQSASSPGGGSTNELRMGDSAGAQEMFLHASKDHTVTVGGAATSTVGANETHDVKLTLKVAVMASQTLAVGGSQSVNVGTDYSVAVKGARSETTAGMESVKVTGNRVVNAAGSYTELVGGAYALQCNQSNSTVSGAFTRLVGAAMGFAGGLGVSESVAAGRVELVGAARTILAGQSAQEDVTGVKSLTAGPTVEQAGGEVATKVKAAGTIRVGGSAKMKAGGPLVITASTVTFQVGGSINAESLKIGGGTFEPRSGTTKIRGTIVRQGGGKISE